MTERGSHGDEGPDDWFGGEPWPTPSDEDRPEGEDHEVRIEDWLAEPAPAPPARGLPTPVLAWIAGGVAVVGVLLGLALAGVFGRAHHLQTTTRSAPRSAAKSHRTTPSTQTTSTTSARTVATVPTQTLKPGDTGDQVIALQHALTTLGYGPGAQDGTYGPATTNAVMRFQQTVGLTADGVFGPKTLAALLQRAGP